MLKHLTGLVLAAALLPTFATAQTRTDEFTETVASAGNSGMVCIVETINYDIPISPFAVTTIQGEPRIGGFSFGLSPLFVEPKGSGQWLTWESLGVDHILNLSWGYNWYARTQNDTAGILAYLGY